ncbi:MAG: hypothetical protein R3C61_02365 [Bacteroidia bacterium]
MAHNYRKFVLGKESPLGFTIFGVVVALIGGRLFFFDGIVLGLVPLIAGLAITFSHTGILLDIPGKRIKEYTWVLFIKFGRWHSLESYPDILVLRRKRSMGITTYGGGATVRTQSEVVFEVSFANPNHLDLFLICRKADEQEAYTLARELEAETGHELVRYNPGKQRPRVKL